MARLKRDPLSTWETAIARRRSRGRDTVVSSGRRPWAFPLGTGRRPGAFEWPGRGAQDESHVGPAAAPSLGAPFLGVRAARPRRRRRPGNRTSARLGYGAPDAHDWTIRSGSPTMDNMARGRAWTTAEDNAIRAAARATRDDGLTLPGTADRAARLAVVARQIGRSVHATRKRAQRIGVWSYPVYRSGHRKILGAVPGGDGGSVTSGENAMFRQAIVAVAVAVAVLAAFPSCVGPAAAPGGQDDEPHVGRPAAAPGDQDAQYGAWRHGIIEDDFTEGVTESVSSFSQEDNLLLYILCRIDTNGRPEYSIALGIPQKDIKGVAALDQFADDAVEVRFDEDKIVSFNDGTFREMNNNTMLMSRYGDTVSLFMLVRLGVRLRQGPSRPSPTPGSWEETFEGRFRQALERERERALERDPGAFEDDYVRELMRIRVNSFVPGAQYARRIVASFPVSGASRALEAMQAPCGGDPYMGY